MATTSTDGKDEELQSRVQQSPLASQRLKQSSAPSESNRTMKTGGFFTLGYKEGFSQWVWN